MAVDVHLGTIRTQIPARLDRLPWTRFHWQVVAGLGTVWILDGLEVTIVGSIGARLAEPGSGIDLTVADIGLAAAIYVAGACLGALFFGQLTDRYGRKNLMMITLTVYILATVSTAFAFAPWYFFLCRFLTGAGIGGEYAAINSAIDELIPARNRGQVDITINGSYWVGSALGGLVALLLLNKSIFAADVGWRIAFGAGALLGLLILLVRRRVPESPRWLFIHGRDQEAEAIVDRIEHSVVEETGEPLAEPGDAITVRQRATIPFREIVKVAVRFYPKRATLGLALFVGQAFLYNAVTFDLGTLLSTFYGVTSSAVPYFVVVFAVGNFAGPFLLGRLFDTVGRKPMISGTYLVSAALTAILALFLVGGGLTAWTFMLLVSLTFFFASAGASSAYLTVSEIFPMETRALAIAFFYALGTGIGGIVGPLLFGNMIATKDSGVIAIGFFIGAVVMAIGGVAELFLGVRAEGVALENIAKPLTVADAERQVTETKTETVPASAGPLTPLQSEALKTRQRAEEERARAAEHRIAQHQLLADGQQNARVRTEQVLAEVAELNAQQNDEIATSYDERASAASATDPKAKAAATDLARAAEERARAYGERAAALAASDRAGQESHQALAEAARERARAREQRALGDQIGTPVAEPTDPAAALPGAQKTVYDAWARVHELRAQALTARAEHAEKDASAFDGQANAEQERARAAEARLDQTRHQAAAGTLEKQAATAGELEQSKEEAAERERRARERDERIRERLERRRDRERHGLHRFLPGPSDTLYSPGMVGTASRWAPTAEQDLDREIDSIGRALDDRGPLSRDELARAVGARHWGPGRFHNALHEAVDEGRVQSLPGGTFGSAMTRTGS
jgi:MFS family permease